MRSTLQIQSQHFLKAGGMALLASAAWQILWMVQSPHPWTEQSPLGITTFIASFIGLLYSLYRLEQPKWLLQVVTGFVLVAYLITLHQTQDIRLMVGLVISHLMLLVLIVD